MKISTLHVPGLLTPEESEDLFVGLLGSLNWGEGVPSRRGHTRLACPLRIGENEAVDSTVAKVISSLGLPLQPVYIYVNLYRDGNDWTPNHTHPGEKQVIVSLGTCRTLMVNKKSYSMGNGDVIVFGSAVHGVPKEPNVVGARISIAVFCRGET